MKSADRSFFKQGRQIHVQNMSPFVWGFISVSSRIEVPCNQSGAHRGWCHTGLSCLLVNYSVIGLFSSALVIGSPCWSHAWLPSLSLRPLFVHESIEQVLYQLEQRLISIELYFVHLIEKFFCSRWILLVDIHIGKKYLYGLCQERSIYMSFPQTYLLLTFNPVSSKSLTI